MVGDHRQWETIDGGERIDGGRESTMATSTSVRTTDTTAAAATIVARFKRSEIKIQTHCFSTLMDYAGQRFR